MVIAKKWVYPQIDKAEAHRISEEFKASPLVGKILASRGFAADDRTKNFLNKKQKLFHDPFLMKDMQNAVDAVYDAIKNNQKIAIFGDYDVDGITSVFVMYDYLKSIGANVIYYIPDRVNEGYGMNIQALDYLKKINVDFIITVDVGITATEEVKYAYDLGMKVVVTDHHTPKEHLPNAEAVINPKVEDDSYPFDGLAGVGVAFKLIYALSGCNEKIFYKYSDIVAVGTIADMVPLADENRYIVHTGVNMLKSTDNIGLKALMEVCDISCENIGTTTVGFVIAPRLNAAGRIANASMSVELLCETDYAVAKEKAEKLNECNKNRQQEEQKIFDEAIEIIKRNNYDKDPFILVGKEDWLHGVIGIVSSRITEMYYKPSAVVSINPDGSGKASGRSVKGINLFSALTSCSEHLKKYGGHELAAGFSVLPNKIEDLRNELNSYCKDNICTDELVPTIEIDSDILLNEITKETIDDLKVLEPYGISNKAPVLCVENVCVCSVRYSHDNKHAFITVSDQDTKCEISAFSMYEAASGLKQGDTISFVGILNLNKFRNTVSAQFIVKDIKKVEKPDCIDRGDLVGIFTAIRSGLSNDKMHISIINDKMISDGKEIFNTDIARVRIAIQIFVELDIICAQQSDSEIIIEKGKNFHKKSDLLNSETFRKYQK